MHYFQGLEYYITTKMDGSSHSIGVDDEGIHVTGHNYEYYDDGSSPFWTYLHEHHYPETICAFYQENHYHTFVIQGELCAPGIQKNRLRLIRPEWYVFTIMVDGKRLSLDEMTAICQKLDLKMVPVEERDIDLPKKYPDVDALIKRADGNYPNGGKKEGLVIRPCIPSYCPAIHAPLSTKVINPRYLLKNEE